MSLVNLIVNFMLGSYRQVTMMPMKNAKLPKYNEVYIVDCLQKQCPGELDCTKRSQHLPRVLAITSVSTTNGDNTLFEGISLSCFMLNLQSSPVKIGYQCHSVENWVTRKPTRTGSSSHLASSVYTSFSAGEEKYGRQFAIT
jgi:hypothetical protein